ncbi:MAG: sigma 54-interacting transcriptional regulator [Sandaracinaceae bacterium]
MDFSDRTERTADFRGIAAPQPSASLVAQDREGPRAAQLTFPSSVTIGRSQTADFQLVNESVSRTHARVVWDHEGLFIEDLESRHGTYVNGARIERARLTAGDIVRVGDVLVSVHARFPSSAGPDEDGPLTDDRRFRMFVRYELDRARALGGGFAVLFLRAPEAPPGWQDSAARVLSGVDRITAYAPQAALLLLPGASRARAREVSANVQVQLGLVSMNVGVATYPESGTSAERLIEAARRASDGGAEPHPSERFVIASASMQRAVALAERVAKLEVPVLIHGETGAGKELVARRIHAASARAERPFVAVNCAAIAEALIESALFGHERGAFTGAERRAEGLFEQAHGGTLFLDEVGELSERGQAALLRALEVGTIRRVGGAEEIAVDVRAVGATHRDLFREQESGRFRSDLYFRLAGFVIEVPPLRERSDDLRALIERFVGELEEQGLAREVSPAAHAALLGYGWPGNVRELRNVLQQAALTSQDGAIDVDDLPGRLRAPPGDVAAAFEHDSAQEELGSDVGADLRARIEAFELEQIRACLEACGGNQTEAAKRLGIPRRTLVHKLKRFGLTKGSSD